MRHRHHHARSWLFLLVQRMSAGRDELAGVLEQLADQARSGPVRRMRSSTLIRRSKFLRNPPQGTLTGIRSNGDVVRYDPEMNMFGVMDVCGAPRTFFKPDPAISGYPTNLDYFNAQF